MRQHLLLIFLTIFALTGCGGGSGSTGQNQLPAGNNTGQSQNPAPATSPKPLSNPLHKEWNSSGKSGKSSLPDMKITNKLLNDPLLTPIEQKNIPQKTADKKSPSGSKEVLRADFKMGKYLRDPYAKPKKNTYLERYGRVRLEKAATIKRYAPVQIMPVNLEAHCSTAWDKGKLHIRVAYYGPPHNLNTFMNETRMLYISFQDEAGSPVYRFEIPIDQMQKAPPEKNFGQPTYEVEGQLPLTLEVYEEFFQWTVEWD